MTSMFITNEKEVWGTTQEKARVLPTPTVVRLEGRDLLSWTEGITVDAWLGGFRSSLSHYTQIMTNAPIHLCRACNLARERHQTLRSKMGMTMVVRIWCSNNSPPVMHLWPQIVKRVIEVYAPDSMKLRKATTTTTNSSALSLACLPRRSPTQPNNPVNNGSLNTNKCHKE